MMVYGMHQESASLHYVSEIFHACVDASGSLICI